MFATKNLTTLTDYDNSLATFDENINDLTMTGIDTTVDTETQNLLNYGESILDDINTDHLTNLDISRTELEARLTQYDAKRNELEKRIGVINVFAFKNKEARLSSTYTLFVIWFFIMIILGSVLFIHIIEEQPQMNFFLKSLIHLVLLFVLFHIFYNMYRYLFIKNA